MDVGVKIRQYFITFQLHFFGKKTSLESCPSTGFNVTIFDRGIGKKSSPSLVLGRKKETDHGIQFGIQQKNSRFPLFVARHLFCVEKKVDNTGYVQYQYQSSFT